MEEVLSRQDDGDCVGAWAAAGVRLEMPADTELAQFARLAGVVAAMVPALVPAATARLTARHAPQRLRMGSISTRDRCHIELRMEQEGLVASIVPVDDARRGMYLPQTTWQRLPDLELLRGGLLGREELHPLVGSALVPEQPDPGYLPWISKSSAADSWPKEFTVSCVDGQHLIGFRAGRLVVLDHDPIELARERVLTALGGQPRPCMRLVDGWRAEGGDGPWQDLPAPLARLREHGVLALLHGRGDELTRLLDAGVDPSGFRDEHGRGPITYQRGLGLSKAIASRLAQIVAQEVQHAVEDLRDWPTVGASGHE
jgi:hypothetical protein